MPKNLVIVESPAKAKTIEGYLGNDFTVKSCYGHVRDLPKGDKAIDIKNGFTPTYEVTDDKKDVIRDLKKLAKQSDTVYLATDDDREGEAISWHLLETLELDLKKTPRIVFHEITKSAILKALEAPRRINIDLVNAQQARRVLDRLVGFELSPVLWRKIKTGLSAGRVQSVAVRLVVEREREIERFNSKSFFRVTAHFYAENKKVFQAELSKKLDTAEEAQALLERCAGAGFRVDSVEKRPTKRTPSPPFTTSTLQQEASRKLGFSVSQTMTLAQRLYEAGKISYMRTDSVNLSEDAIRGASSAIASAFGDEYVHQRRYKTKNESAQEAHEAIRPTDFRAQTAGGERNEQRLYELIWRRAIASQMADARLEKTTAEIDILPSTPPSPLKERFIATGEVILFDGFMKVYVEDNDNEPGEDDDSAILPPLAKGQMLEKRSITARERFTRAAARYTEASLVKKLEELGIGRPSTYAPTISTIIKREYVVKESREGKARPYQELVLHGNDKIDRHQKSENTGAEKAKLFPTDVGAVVNDFLVDRFPDIVDFGFTASVEKEFDQIAEGHTEWDKMIGRFYTDFHKSVEDTANLDRSAINTGGRTLGQHPETGQKISVRLGRFGPMAMLGDPDVGEKPAYASLRKDQRMETITLDEALNLFKLPRMVGEYKGQEMVASTGRFGPYIRWEGKFYSLPKDDNPLEITPERAIEIIDTKDLAEANKIIKTFAEDATAKVVNGRFGPYVVFGTRNLKIPKGTAPDEVTFEDVLKYAEEQPVKPIKGSRGRAASKEAAKPKAEAKPKAARKPAAKKAAPKANAKTSTTKKK